MEKLNIINNFPESHKNEYQKKILNMLPMREKINLIITYFPDNQKIRILFSDIKMMKYKVIVFFLLSTDNRSIPVESSALHDSLRLLPRHIGNDVLKSGKSDTPGHVSSFGVDKILKRIKRS